MLKIPKTKKKSVCVCKCMTVLSHNDVSDSETVATADQPDSENVLSKETIEMKIVAFQEGYVC